MTSTTARKQRGTTVIVFTRENNRSHRGPRPDSLAGWNVRGIGAEVPMWTVRELRPEAAQATVVQGAPRAGRKIIAAGIECSAQFTHF